MHVKIADFGLSKIKEDLHPLTGGLGTYQWMAPEVISHTRYTESADVYSFGIVLWECVARQVPYPGQAGFSAAVSVMTRCGLLPCPTATAGRVLAEANAMTCPEKDNSSLRSVDLAMCRASW